MSRRIFSVCMLATAALAALVAGPGTSAAKKKAPLPAITVVSPMRVGVGGTLTISGRNFKTRDTKNTLVFRGAHGRFAFVKPRKASGKKLVVKVPSSVAGLLHSSDNVQKPTRMKLRVLAGELSKYTPRRLSPVVVGAG
jgi:phosphate-selective porin